MSSVISVKNLSQRYGKGRVIYENLSFEVPKGRILGLLGKNGTGKTTTINILMGFLKPQSGECRIFGEDITRMSPQTRSRIALLLEGHVQYAFMTISQIERGDYSPSVTLALKLAKLCQVSVEDIFSYEEDVRNEAEK